MLRSFKDGTNQRSDVCAQTANLLSEKSVFQPEDLKNPLQARKWGWSEKPNMFTFCAYRFVPMRVAVELCILQTLRSGAGQEGGRACTK